MISRLISQLAQKEGITEALKANDQIEWVGRMNNIRNRTTEIVNAEIFVHKNSAERGSENELYSVFHFCILATLGY